MVRVMPRLPLLCLWAVSAAVPTLAQPAAPSWLSPGKADLLYTRANEVDNGNLIWWTPSFKGGAGEVFANGSDTHFAGGYLRPLVGRPGSGELILMTQHVWTPSSHLWEAQAEYRLPVGLGFGAGLVEQPSDKLDVRFGKVTFRSKAFGAGYILEGQVQSVGSHTSPGGYGAVFSDVWMITLGGDGEQWRACLGLVGRDKGPLKGPAFEALYVDNDIGKVPGVRSLFVNGTLRMRGLFLSHPARLGRALGPQGLEFGNPLGFLVPTWNRRLDIWEMGSLLSARLERLRQPNGNTSTAYDAAAFPVEFLRPRAVLARVFVGGGHVSSFGPSSTTVYGGYYGMVGPLTLSLRLGRDLDRKSMVANVGVLRFF